MCQDVVKNILASNSLVLICLYFCLFAFFLRKLSSNLFSSSTTNSEIYWLQLSGGATARSGSSPGASLAATAERHQARGRRLMWTPGQALRVDESQERAEPVTILNALPWREPFSQRTHPDKVVRDEKNAAPKPLASNKKLRNRCGRLVLSRIKNEIRIFSMRCHTESVSARTPMLGQRCYQMETMVNL